MSGIFINGDWHENTDMICCRCKLPVWESNNPGYTYQCLNCDEDLYVHEVEEQDPHYLPKVIVARRVDGIIINTALEYVLDDSNEKRVFINKAAAEAFLLGAGLNSEDLEHMYFIEFEHEPKEATT